MGQTYEVPPNLSLQHQACKVAANRDKFDFSAPDQHLGGCGTDAPADVGRAWRVDDFAEARGDIAHVSALYRGDGAALEVSNAPSGERHLPAASGSCCCLLRHLVAELARGGLLLPVQPPVGLLEQLRRSARCRCRSDGGRR